MLIGVHAEGLEVYWRKRKVLARDNEVHHFLFSLVPSFLMDFFWGISGDHQLHLWGISRARSTDLAKKGILPECDKL